MVPSAAKRDKASETTPRPAEVNNHIGALLRTMHDSVLDEAVPDRLLDLLRQIDGKTDEALAKPR